jgi:CRP-like cAMP-binding protein
MLAVERSITLSLTADEFLALLSENVELTEGLFRMLIATRNLGAGHTLIHGSLPPDMKNAAHLHSVDRALVLQSSPLLAHATSAQLWRLSSIAHERTIAPNADALQKGADPALLIVLSGSLNVEGNGQSATATAGDSVGLYETLAGSRIEATITAINEAKVLRIDRQGIFELLADHTDLLQGVFSILLRSTRVTASAASRSGSTISNTVSTP